MLAMKFNAGSYQAKSQDVAEAASAVTTCRVPALEGKVN
jgi:hypothetical protein